MLFGELFRLYHGSANSVCCPLVQSSLHELIASRNEAGCTEHTRQQLRLDLPAECNNFDWNSECDLKRDDISPMVFRPGQPESPVGVDFDHERASLGEFNLLYFKVSMNGFFHGHFYISRVFQWNKYPT